jgi:hypothetical protein
VEVDICNDFKNQKGGINFRREETERIKNVLSVDVTCSNQLFLCFAVENLFTLAREANRFCKKLLNNTGLIVIQRHMDTYIAMPTLGWRDRLVFKMS